MIRASILVTRIHPEQLHPSRRFAGLLTHVEVVVLVNSFWALSIFTRDKRVQPLKASLLLFFHAFEIHALLCTQEHDVLTVRIYRKPEYFTPDSKARHQPVMNSPYQRNLLSAELAVT